MSIVDMKALKLYAENDINVLLSGHHGVGKTAIIKEIFTAAFGEINKDWLYFSGATMDAWTNFVGCPKSVIDENGMEVLDIIPPKAMAYNNIKAIFIDEYNRAPKPVRNAVMELLQFKSVNGRSFDNLKVVWGAINPSDDEDTYDVDKLDPAQEDRFEIQLDIPYKLNQVYLKSTYGDSAIPFMEWWNALDKETRLLVSPRRLDKAIKINGFGGNLAHVFNKKLNLNDLKDRIKKGSALLEFKDFMAQPASSIKKDLMNPDIINKYAVYLVDKNYKNYWAHVNKEFIASSANPTVKELRKAIEGEKEQTRDEKAKNVSFKNGMSNLDDDLIEDQKSAVKKAKKKVFLSVDSVKHLRGNFSPTSLNANDSLLTAAVFNRKLTKLSKLPERDPRLIKQRDELYALAVAEFDRVLIDENPKAISLFDVFRKRHNESASYFSLTGNYRQSMIETFRLLEKSSIRDVKSYAAMILTKMGLKPVL